MDLTKMIAELRAERSAIEEALIVLERIAAGSTGRRRGRPPAWMAAVRASDLQQPAAEEKTRTVNPEARKRMAEAQKKRWAAYRKAQAALPK
jgi:hypothetical protein